MLNLSGQQLSPDAEFYLQPEGSAAPVIVPAESQVAATLDSARLVFRKEQLAPGNYTVYVKNPGGLKAGMETFRIIEPLVVENVDEAAPEPEAESPAIAPAPPDTPPQPLGPAQSLSPAQPVDFYLALDYAPLFPLYGELNQVVDQPVFPLGAQIRFGIVPFKWAFGNLGVELAFDWHYFHSVINDYDVSFHAPGEDLSIVFQKWFPSRTMALNFHAGVGLGIITDIQITNSGGDTSSSGVFLTPRITLGASFLYMFTRSFFAEAGIDYTHWFSADDPSPGYLRPGIGVGYRL
ncbi:hypothetical protein FACS1894147_11440 [Spirochaetia bacterium]|nr:hypothetical protein FACS1894147_11440 [Spirochaetia bacterium]